MRNINGRICIIIVLLALVSRSKGYTSFGNCSTPTNKIGKCVHIIECPRLYNLLLGTTRSQADVVFLQKSQCAYDNTQTEPGRRVMVCCECPEHAATSESDDIARGNHLPSASVCGYEFGNRIYGGNLTKIDEFPWTALIGYKRPGGSVNHFCGGVLINTRYVLTAAHCVKNDDLSAAAWTLDHVRLGEWNIETNPDCEVDSRGKSDCAPPHMDVPIEEAIAHELYVQNSMDQFHDIALIRMARGMRYGDFIKPICLPVFPTLREKNFTDVYMDVAGWGLTEKGSRSTHKLKASMRIWDVEMCRPRYQRYRINIREESQLCAGGEDNVDTCRGDSGGPLMVKEHLGNRDTYFVVGIVSRGPQPCGINGWPGVYTRVGNYIEWIAEKLKP